MPKNTAPISPLPGDGTPDRKGFLERLEHGIARLQAGDLSILAPAMPTGINMEAAIELGTIVSQIAEAAAIATMAEAAILGACQAAGMDETMLIACRQRGRRKGRDAFGAAMRDLLAGDPFGLEEQGGDSTDESDHRSKTKTGRSAGSARRR